MLWIIMVNDLKNTKLRRHVKNVFVLLKEWTPIYLSFREICTSPRSYPRGLTGDFVKPVLCTSRRIVELLPVLVYRRLLGGSPRRSRRRNVREERRRQPRGWWAKGDKLWTLLWLHWLIGFLIEWETCFLLWWMKFVHWFDAETLSARWFIFSNGRKHRKCWSSSSRIGCLT